MMYRLNKCERRRDEIMFGGHDVKAYMGGIRHFENLSFDKFEDLINGDFINLSDRQNEAPSIKKIYEFMKRYPEYTAHGYAVSVMRDDYRVSLEGVSKEYEADSADEFDDFTELFKHADDFVTSSIMHCWFD